MNTHIKKYVDELEASLMQSMLNNEKVDLFDIASKMLINKDKEQFINVCQAYEVVKHKIAG